MFKLVYKPKKNKKRNKKGRKNKKFVFQKIMHKLKKILDTAIQLTSASRCYRNNLLEINILDIEKNFFCDNYIASRHLSEKKDDNGFPTRYTTQRYNSSLSPFPTSLLSVRCAKKNVSLLIYKPKQSQLFLPSKPLYITTIPKDTDKNLPIEITSIKNNYQIHLDKTDNFYSYGAIAQQMVCFVPCINFKYFSLEKICSQKSSGSSPLKNTKEMFKTTEQNSELYGNYNNYLFIIKTDITKAVLLKIKHENSENYPFKQPKIENNSFD